MTIFWQFRLNIIGYILPFMLSFEQLPVANCRRVPAGLQFSAACANRPTLSADDGDGCRDNADGCVRDVHDDGDGSAVHLADRSVSGRAGGAHHECEDVRVRVSRESANVHEPRLDVARAVNTNAKVIAVFQASTDWVKVCTRRAIDWISDT